MLMFADVEILKLVLGQYSEDEIWSIFFIIYICNIFLTYVNTIWSSDWLKAWLGLLFSFLMISIKIGVAHYKCRTRGIVFPWWYSKEVSGKKTQKLSEWLAKMTCIFCSSSCAFVKDPILLIKGQNWSARSWTLVAWGGVRGLWIMANLFHTTIQ